jgi:hypothetical protein
MAALATRFPDRKWFGYRNGGSPNIFGLQNFSRTYRNSVVDQSYDWSRTDTYAFTCNSFRWEVVDHETVTDPTAGDSPALVNARANPETTLVRARLIRR